ncbi:MAG: tetratricopeptide repeat protein [Anaerolineales bacterium]|nr:tetratricopeptide repeat protein [Anaerolineales bacterium]
MAEIALRNYVNEIDELIESGRQIDQAIDHCRQILKEYPKHVASYRLLGKAFLEKKQYSDSADIFARVLSAIPDDFVSHIGMAIVREDEGNLDDAIWHMERAFEANPANTAIQQELRRLILKRDGLEPQKIRLTRGALARVYAHGELYPQAIAEINAALAEDSSRIDLQVLLADVHLKSGNLQQAGEISFRILEKLPNCLLANRIAAAFLINSGQPKEAEPFFERVKTMDPYAAYLSTPLEDPASIPESKIIITKSSGTAVSFSTESVIEQADWAASLRTDLGEAGFAAGAASELPNWLESVNGEQESIEAESDETPSIHPFAGAPLPEQADIPEWMRDAGWTEANGEAVEGPIRFSDNELEQLESGQLPDEVELAPAELPSWLQDVAPESVTSTPPDEEPELPTPDDSDMPDWLQDVQQEPVSRPEPPVGVEETRIESEEAAESSPGSQPDVDSMQETDLPNMEDSQENDTDLGIDESLPSLPSWLEEATPGATETIVTWLGDKSRDSYRKPELSQAAGKIENTDSTSDVDEPTSLSDSAGAGEAIIPDRPPLPPAPDQTTDSEQVEPPEFDSSYFQTVESDNVLESEKDLPDWLDTISDAASNEELREEEVDVPDWIHSMADQTGEPAPVPPTTEAESPSWLSEDDDEGEVIPDQNLPEWLTQPTDDLPVSSQMEADSPDWLSEQAEPQEAPQPPREAPQWISDISEPTAEPETTAEYLSEPSDLDWLEELVDDTPDISTPATPADSPDWLAGVIEQEPAEKEDFSSMEADEIDWLREYSGEKPTAETSESTERTAGDDWFSEILPDSDEIAGEDSDEVDWLQQVVRSDVSDEDIAAASDTPTLVSETQWKDEGKSIYERPTIPSNRPVIEMEDLSDYETGVEEEDFEPDSAVSENDADALLAEIIARNTRSTVPDTLRATQDELENLEFTAEEEKGAQPTETAPSVPLSVEEIETAAVIESSVAEVSETEEIEEGVAPDWLTELATEEGFSAAPSTSDTAETVDEPVFEETPAETYETTPQPVEWIPEEAQGEGKEEPDALETERTGEFFTELIPDSLDLTDEDLQDHAPYITEEELTSALDWLDETAPAPRPEATQLAETEKEPVSAASEDVPATQIVEEEIETEDFFETLAAEEEVQTQRPSTEDATEAVAADSSSLSEDAASISDLAEYAELPSMEIAQPEFDLEIEPTYELVEETAEAFDKTEEEPPVLTDEEETEPEASQTPTEYKRTGILSQRDLPEDISKGLEWLSDLAVSHDKSISGVPVSSSEPPSPEELNKAAPSVQEEPAVEIIPGTTELPSVSENLGDTGVSAADVETVSVDEQKVPAVASEEVGEETHLPSTDKIEDTFEEKELPAIEPEEIIPEEKKIWKVTLTAQKSKPVEEEEEELVQPVQPEPSGEETEIAVPAEDDEEPAWLHPSEEVMEPPPADQDEDIPEWLQSEEPSEPPSAPAEQPEVSAAEKVKQAGRTAREQPAPEKPKKKSVAEAGQELIEKARQSLAADDLDGAIEQYRILIKRRKNLQESIDDLRSAIVDYPDSALLWQTLGDAYMQNNQPTTAIEAYQHGMDVV